MTFRAKPVDKRPQRPSWAGSDRRHLYMNIGFGLVVVAAILLLVIATGLSWYDDHLSSVATVNGQSITQDQFNDRLKIENFRMDEADRRVRDAQQAGRLTDSQFQTQEQAISQQKQNLNSIALERLVDAALQGSLAKDEGITATPADIDARLVTEATIQDFRHVWVIAVTPDTDPGSSTPTDAQKAAAKAKADAALAQITGGKAFADVAKTVSTDASTAAQGGDLGWIAKDDTSSPEDFLDAVFGATKGTPTDVLEGADGTYRIGLVTDDAPATTDPNYTAKITAAGVDLNAYRTAVAADVIHQKLEDKVVADAIGPSPQRQVQEIYIAAPSSDPGPDAIKVRHILYSPKGDPTGASNGSIPDTDPSWAAAQAKAEATYAKLKADPQLFDSIARSESDELPARGPTGTGGKLPYFDSSMAGQVDKAFLDAILAPGLQSGQLLAPVKSSFGWHVIQVLYRPSDMQRMIVLKSFADVGRDFGVLARDNSEAPSAGTGGDLGWIAKGQLTNQLETAIFAAPVGKTSDIVNVTGDGLYLFKVLAEETRTPAGRQLDTIKSSAFASWYAAKKSAATITRDPTLAAPATTGG